MGSIDVDGAAVLRAIVDHPNAFPDIKAEIVDTALKLVTAQLKAKSTSLATTQDIYRAIGAKDLERILDSVADAQIKTLAKKLDTNNTEVTTATPQWHRKHIVLLATGGVTPVAKAASVTRKTSSAKKPTLTQEQAETKKALAAASIKLVNTRELWRAIGEASFTTVLGSMTESMIAKLASRLDPDHSDLAPTSTEWKRDHIVALAASRAEPTSILESKAMSAKRVKASGHK